MRFTKFDSLAESSSRCCPQKLGSSTISNHLVTSSFFRFLSSNIITLTSCNTNSNQAIMKHSSGIEVSIQPLNTPNTQCLHELRPIERNGRNALGESHVCEAFVPYVQATINLTVKVPKQFDTSPAAGYRSALIFGCDSDLEDMRQSSYVKKPDMVGELRLLCRWHWKRTE